MLAVKYIVFLVFWCTASDLFIYEMEYPLIHFIFGGQSVLTSLSFYLQVFEVAVTEDPRVYFMPFVVEFKLRRLEKYYGVQKKIVTEIN